MVFNKKEEEKNSLVIRCNIIIMITYVKQKYKLHVYTHTV